jgi:hypothetical protein
MRSHEQFSKTMYKKGMTRKFLNTSVIENDAVGHPSTESEYENEIGESGSLGNPEEINQLDPGVDVYSTLIEYTFDLVATPELSRIFKNIIVHKQPVSGDIISWISHNYRNSKGFEIATTNLSLLPLLFFDQAARWHALAF